MVVESVMAGVVVGFATVPANPLEETIDTLVTVPTPPLPGEVQVMGAPKPPADVSNWPEVPGVVGRLKL
jgi:hypothetical protein